jgi:hypothetical protein
MEEFHGKLQRIGSTVDEFHLGKQVKHVIAGLLCDHTESKNRPCPNCQLLAKNLAGPVARFAVNAAMGNRADTAIGKWDGYASLGSALDLFFKEAHVILTDPAHLRRNTPEKDRGPGIHPTPQAPQSPGGSESDRSHGLGDSGSTDAPAPPVVSVLDSSSEGGPRSIPAIGDTP